MKVHFYYVCGTRTKIWILFLPLTQSLESPDARAGTPPAVSLLPTQQVPLDHHVPARRCSSRSVIRTIITLHSHFQLLYSSRQKRPTLLIKTAIIKIEALCCFCLLNILQTLPQIPNFKAPLRVPISWLICKAIACVITQCRRWAVLMAAFGRLTPLPCTHLLTFCITIPQESAAESTALGFESPTHCSPIPCSCWPSPLHGPGCGWRTRAGESECILFARANENGF